MKNKLIIKEQASAETESFQNQDLQLARANGCFPKDTKETKDSNGIIVAYTASKKYPGFTAIYYPDKTLKYTNNNLKSFDETKTTTWFCQALNDVVTISLTPVVDEFVNSLKNVGFKVEKFDDIKGKDRVSGAWKYTKLIEYINANPSLNNLQFVTNRLKGQIDPAYVWVYQGVSEREKETSLRKKMIELGWSICTADDLLDGYSNKKIAIDINTNKEIIIDNEKFCKPIVPDEIITTQATSLVALSEAVAGSFTVKNCRKLIDKYVELADIASLITQETINNAKERIGLCMASKTIMDNLDKFLTRKSKNYSTTLQDFRNKIVRNKVFPNNKRLSRNWSLSTGSATTYKESMENNKENHLKQIVKNNLLEIIEKKNKVLNEEYKIVNSRLSIIKEGGRPKSELEEKKLIKEIVDELFYLHKQGYNSELISEQFLDFFGALFGQKTQESVLETFKEYAVDWIIKKLTPLDPDGWVASVLETAIAEIPIGDWFKGKVFKCDYLVDKLSRGMVEGTIKYMGQQKGLSGGFVDLVRNRITEALEDTKFSNDVEGFLTNLICPGWSQVESKMSGAISGMQEKALS